MVTLAIVSVLAALLTPVFDSMKSRVKLLNCANNLRQIGLAMNMYATENSERYPMPYNGHSDSGDWRLRTDVYLGTRAHRIETRKTSYAVYQTSANEIGKNKVWFCGAAKKIPDDDFEYKLHYSMNQYATGRSAGPGGSVWNLRRNVIPQPTRTILVGEANGFQLYNFGYPLKFTGDEGSSRRVSHQFRSYLATTEYGANYLFCDGHVEYLKGVQDDNNPDTYTGKHKMWKWW
jgi:prepilin-type processing-associated H-X9-DG protein